MGARIQASWEHGLRIPGFPLVLDSRRVVPRGFVSHAHSDHFARHGEIWCSEATASLIRGRYNVARDRIVAIPWEEPREFEGWEVTLFPAGHIFGSAMIRLRDPSGASLLYTGDFKTRAGLASEICQPVPAEVLVMETTFATPKYVLPPNAEVWESVREFVRTALDSGEIPVLLGYSLGKAQEILAAVSGMGVPIRVHESVARMTAVYTAELEGFSVDFTPFGSGPPDGCVLVFPPNLVRKDPLKSLPGIRTAMLSGWGLNSSAKYQYGVDVVFPLSDHADFEDSLEFVEAVDPRQVYTLHGFSREFAAELRARGRGAWSIHGGDQLELFDLEGRGVA